MAHEDEEIIDDDLDDEEDHQTEQEELDTAKEVQRERERASLIAKLASGNMSHLTTRVAFILNQYPDARNSDVTLQLKYWKAFQNDIYKDGTFQSEDLYRLERLTSITRARAKIQNEFKLFHANEGVRRYRRNREEYEREAQLYTRPSVPTINIYCDESGKTSKHVMVGSVWIHDQHRETEIRTHFREWKKRKGLSINKEFHFTEMSRNELPLYKEFVNEILSVSEMMSFVLVVAERTQGRKIDDLVFDLHYQLVHQGIQYETEARRITLPRQINFWKDKEDGTDKLMMAKLEQHLVSNFELYFKDELRLALFSPIESYTSPFIQMADVFTGCISRLLNQSGGRNQKDELASYLTELFGVSIEDGKVTTTNDLVTVYEFY